MSERTITDAEEEARYVVEGWLSGAEELLRDLRTRTDQHPEDHITSRRHFATAVRDAARKLRALPAGHPAWPALRTALWCGLNEGFSQSMPNQYHAERRLRLLREETGRDAP